MNNEILENEQESVQISTSRGTVYMSEDDLFILLQNARCGARMQSTECFEKREHMEYHSYEYDNETSAMKAFDDQWFFYKAIGESLKLY